MKQILPIRPEEVVEIKGTLIPSEIIDIFNKLITIKMVNGRAKIGQNEVLDLIESFYSVNHVEKKYTRQEVFDNGFLDVEDIFKKAGWNVTYDKGAYYDTFEPYFTFTVEKNAKT